MNFKNIFTANKLRQKLRERTTERKFLKQRNKELTKSRDDLRVKYRILQEDFEKLAEDKKLIEAELKKS